MRQELNYFFLIKKTGDTDNYKLFLTTDLEEVATEALGEFGAENLLITDGLYTHIDREKQSSDCKRVYKTFLDLHFMRNCDGIVISNSNFGKFGIMLRPEPTKQAFMFRSNRFIAVDNSLNF